MSIDTNLKYLFLKKFTLGNMFSNEKGGLLNIPMLSVDRILLKMAPNELIALLVGVALVAATSVTFLDSSAITSMECTIYSADPFLHIFTPRL